MAKRVRFNETVDVLEYKLEEKELMEKKKCVTDIDARMRISRVYINKYRDFLECEEIYKAFNFLLVDE